MGSFLPFYLPNRPKDQNLENGKKTPGDIIILQQCTKNHDPMLYCFWDMVCDRCNYFSFWAIFCPFTPLTTQKVKTKKNEKNTWRYYRFTKAYQKLYCSWWHVTDVIVIFYFGLFFVLLPSPSLTAQKIKILKKWKTAWRYHHFTYVYHKLWLDDVQFLRYGVRRTEKVTYRGRCPT